MHLKDKVVVVTGGSKGIGKAVAAGFIREGARVVICGREEDNLRKTAIEISSPGNECIAIKCNVKNSSQVRDLVNYVTGKFTTIDILINNAGTACYKSLGDTSEEEWDNVISVNLRGTFLFCKECIPHMKDGIIINISSGAGKSGFPGFSAYCASKFGVIGLTESMAPEIPHIKVYALCPGSVNTDLFRSIFNYSPPAQPEDIATFLIDLCKKGNYPSGSSIEVN